MLDIKKLRRLPKGADLSHIQPDLHVLAVPIGALSGHPDNPRLHGDANRKAIAGSLRKYLQRKPVVANMTEQGLLIEAGHGVYGEMLAAGAQYVAVTVVQHELCFYGWMRGNKPAWYGDKSQTSVWDDFGRDSDHGMHPTQKPIELFLRPMKNHVKHGEWVYEPFGGSGSQLLAAERHGCLAATMEIAPKYVAVILQRAKDAGLQPRLADV